MSTLHQLAGRAGGRISLPQFLHLQRIPLRVVLVTAAASYAFSVGAILMGFPLWVIALAALAPWAPMVFLEEIWKYQHYGFLSVFAAIAFLQAGHMMEHIIQLGQLAANHGNMAKAHGVFGQLDIEAVHTTWDVGVWLAVCVLVLKFGTRNRWLWVALVAVSLHSVEHVYIAWILQTDPVFYKVAGSTGLLAAGGVIGSPLPRVYLHFLYNTVVTMALVVALWEQTHIAYDTYLARALPDMRQDELVGTSSRLRRLALQPGEEAYHQGDSPESFYVVAHGLLESIRDGSRVALIHPGHFFGETGLMGGHRRRSTVRAVEHSELLVLDQAGFDRMVGQSEGARRDVQSAMAEMQMAEAVTER